jgi:hypothetical protein
MKIDSRILGLATAVGVAGAFTACTLVVAIIPGGATAFLSYALHIDITDLARPVTWGGFLAGLLLTTAYFGVLVAAIAGIYNRWIAQRSGSSTAAGERLHAAP